MMNIKTILSVLVVGVLLVLTGPPQDADARSLLNSNAATAAQKTTEVKSTNRHHWGRRHRRHQGWTHHLHPGW
jgi:hypothetical protein